MPAAHPSQLRVCGFEPLLQAGTAVSPRATPASPNACCLVLYHCETHNQIRRNGREKVRPAYVIHLRRIFRVYLGYLIIMLRTSVVTFKISIASTCKICVFHIMYLFCSFFNKVGPSRQEEFFIPKCETPGKPKIGRCSVLDD